jgi:hypothetical protein
MTINFGESIWLIRRVRIRIEKHSGENPRKLAPNNCEAFAKNPSIVRRCRSDISLICENAVEYQKLNG